MEKTTSPTPAAAATRQDEEPPPASASKSGGSGGGGGDKLKRDEWSEGAVSSLLEAYEAKWVLRNRAKLKGHDWEEVARFVSSTTEPPKTQTQCKNKIESMKKRYRSESSAAASSWPLYERIHRLLRGNNNTAGRSSRAVDPVVALPHHPQLITTSPLEIPSPAPLSVQFPTAVIRQSASTLEPNGVVFSLTKVSPNMKQGTLVTYTWISNCYFDYDRSKQEEDGAKLSHSDRAQRDKTAADANTTDSTSTTPAFKGKRPSSSNTRKRKKKHKSEGVLIAESVWWLAEAVVRMEKERMEALRDVEKMRAEAEIRRGELELKRTRIIADMQLEIARLFSGRGAQATTPSFQPGTS